MSLTLGPLVVEAEDPEALAAFWTTLLGARECGRLLTFRPQERPKTVKNRVHVDLYVRDVTRLVDLGARVLAEHPGWTTMADPEGNEFCAFPDPQTPAEPPARLFAVCVDSDRPEELAAWWAERVGAQVRDGPDGTPRWLYGSAGWEDVIWKFVRVADARVVPNRWQWSLRSDPGVRVDPQGNQFSVCRRGCRSGSAAPCTSDAG
ncbi:VOC family protein [Mycolicibacterium phlei]|uniref:VOC family protein n=1 Tax=Mycolicibacterium phlei TaxID=1771 RepID=UPI0037C5F658